MWHCEVRDGLLPIGDEDVEYVVLSGWSCDHLFRVGCETMSKKRLLMSTGYECPCMVQSGQLMSGMLRSPPPHPEYRVFVSATVLM